MPEAVTEKERLEPWLDDGNIVIASQGKYFRVHRSVLCLHSEVFKDMFTIPHSCNAEEETVDGCPVIHLPDAAGDIEIMLKALYYRSYVFFPDTPMPIAVLSAFLRLGKKYIIRQLFKEAERCLSFNVPLLVRASTITSGNVVLFPRVSGADPFNFMIMNAAADVGLHSVAIIAAIYCCIACSALSIADGYDFNGIRCILSASNKRYCLLLQRYLADVENQRFQCLAYPASNCYNSRHSNSCTTALLYIVRSIQYLSPFTTWITGWDNSLCSTCQAELKRKYEEARTRLWNNLPIDLGFGPWETIDKEAEIS